MQLISRRLLLGDSPSTLTLRLDRLTSVSARRAVSTSPVESSVDPKVWRPLRKQDRPRRVFQTKHANSVFRPTTTSLPEDVSQRLPSGSAQHELGRKLRSALKQGQEPSDILGDDSHSQRRWGLKLGKRPRQRRQLREKMEHVAAATATLGKYHGATVTAQYAADKDLLNELDGILVEDGQRTEAFEAAEKFMLEPPKRTVMQQATKPPSPSWEKLGDFERRLFRSPYARMLADPIRKCVFTGVRIPSPLATGLNVKLDTESGAMVAVPSEFQDRTRDIYTEGPYLINGDPLSLHAAMPHFEKLEPATIDEKLEKRHPDDPVVAPNQLLTESEFAVRRVRRTYPMDVSAPTNIAELNRQRDEVGLSARAVDAVKPKLFALSTPEVLGLVPSMNTQKYRKAFPNRWREHLGVRLLGAVALREDLESFVLKLMRRRTARFLANLEHTGQRMVLPMVDTALEVFLTPAGVLSTVISDHVGQCASKYAAALVGAEDPAAILWFGNRWGDRFPHTDNLSLSKDASDRAQQSRLPSVPVYNMQQLFSKIEWDWLRSLRYSDEGGKHESAFSSSQAVMTESIWSGRSLGLLWRLQLFSSTSLQAKTQKSIDTLDDNGL